MKYGAASDLGPESTDRRPEEGQGGDSNRMNEQSAPQPSSLCNRRKQVTAGFRRQHARTTRSTRRDTKESQALKERGSRQQLALLTKFALLERTAERGEVPATVQDFSPLLFFCLDKISKVRAEAHDAVFLLAFLNYFHLSRYCMGVFVCYCNSSFLSVQYSTCICCNKVGQPTRWGGRSCRNGTAGADKAGVLDKDRRL